MKWTTVSAAVASLAIFGCGDDASSSGSGGGGGGGATSSQGPATSASSHTASPELSFFVTSVGNGTGDFGGVSGTDSYCQGLADLVGSARTWRAYVSSGSEDARDRIGAGPWRNAAGVVIAADVAELHASGVAASVIVDEFGDGVPTVSPDNQHDILTGSNGDGTFSGENCADFTSASIDDVATVGHADAADPLATEDGWNSAHLTTGCDNEQLVGTGGTGRLYCFAID